MPPALAAPLQAAPLRAMLIEWSRRTRPEKDPMINANQYSATTQAISDAISESKRETKTVGIEATGTVRDAVETQLLVECEGHDDNGTYWGQDVDGNEWQVRLCAG